MRQRRGGAVNAETPVRVMTSRDGTCLVDGCESRIVSRQLCGKHNSRMFRYGDPTVEPLSDEERFWPNVSKIDDGCWTWTRYCNPAGYGIFSWDDGTIASRFSWSITNGPIPDGLDVLHKCDNPPCVRPDHLFLGTDADNMADKISKGRGNYYSGGPKAKKLTWTQVEEVRALRGVLTLRQLAAKYGVTVSSIWSIHDCRTWDPAKRRSGDL